MRAMAGRDHPLMLVWHGSMLLISLLPRTTAPATRTRTPSRLPCIPPHLTFSAADLHQPQPSTALCTASRCAAGCRKATIDPTRHFPWLAAPIGRGFSSLCSWHLASGAHACPPATPYTALRPEPVQRYWSRLAGKVPHPASVNAPSLPSPSFGPLAVSSFPVVPLVYLLADSLQTHSASGSLRRFARCARGGSPPLTSLPLSDQAAFPSKHRPPRRRSRPRRL